MAVNMGTEADLQPAQEAADEGDDVGDGHVVGGVPGQDDLDDCLHLVAGHCLVKDRDVDELADGICACAHAAAVTIPAQRMSLANAQRYTHRVHPERAMLCMHFGTLQAFQARAPGRQLQLCVTKESPPWREA